MAKSKPSKSKWAVCDSCGQEMKPGGGCTVTKYDDFKDQISRDRVPYPADEEKPCHDCNCGPGKLHHPGCDMERCPKCSGQSLSCDCSVFSEENGDDSEASAAGMILDGTIDQETGEVTDEALEEMDDEEDDDDDD